MATNRSPNYPGISLPEAVSLVTKLFEREKRAPVDAEAAALALGYRGLSGASRTKLSALRKFDLVEQTGTGIRVSDLAMAILHPTNPDEKREALRRAATTPALFRDLAEFPGASDENLVSRLVRLGFTESGAKQAVASFRKTMSLAPDEAGGYDEPYDEMQEDLAPMVAGMMEGRKGALASTNRGSTLDIRLPGGGSAELRLPDRLTPDGLEAVVQWLRSAPEVPEAEEAADDSPRLLPSATAPEPPVEQSPTDAQD